MSELTWYVVSRPDGWQPAEWHRTVGVATDGTVFVPASLTDRPERTVFLCAGYDGIGVVLHDNGHAYFPASWIAETYPKAAIIAGLIERDFRDRGRRADG